MSAGRNVNGNRKAGGSGAYGGGERGAHGESGEGVQSGTGGVRKAVFLDRDGVINISPGEGKFVLKKEDFRLGEGVPEALARLKAAGFLLIAVTNQSCVGRGLIKAETLEEIHDLMRRRLVQRGAALDAVYCCPHGPEDGCECRKPSPAMILRASRRFGIDLRSSWMVGDSPRDIQTGRAAGCRTILLCSGGKHQAAAPSVSCAPDAVARSLPEAAAVILGEAAPLILG